MLTARTGLSVGLLVVFVFLNSKYRQCGLPVNFGPKSIRALRLQILGVGVLEDVVYPVLHVNGGDGMMSW